jgi:hypothetical protein
MATATTTPVRKTQDWVLRTVKESQKAVSDTVSIWANVVEHAIPATKKLAIPKTVPTTKIVGPTFDLAEKVLEAQRQFATSVADAVGAPIVRKPARKTTAGA